MSGSSVASVHSVAKTGCCAEPQHNAPSFQRVEVSGYVARIGLVDAELRHRGARIDLGRVLDPPDQIVGRVRQHTGDIEAIRQLGQRWTDETARIRHTGDQVVQP